MRLFKPVVCHPDYWVTNYGEIFTPTGKLMSPFKKDSRGYLKIKFGKKHRKVHTLVLEAFVGPRPDGMECRHLDGNPMNNRLENICWGTRLENARDRVRHRAERMAA